MRPALARRVVAPRAAAVAYDDLVPSGLNGKAMEFPPKEEFPTRAEVLGSIPEECCVKDTAKSLMYAAISTAMTVGCGVLAYLYIPMQLAFWPVWLAYAAVTGTAATGCWVIAHECATTRFPITASSRTPWVHPALASARAVLLVAAEPRRAPQPHEPPHRGRDARAVRQG